MPARWASCDARVLDSRRIDVGGATWACWSEVGAQPTGESEATRNREGV